MPKITRNGQKLREQGAISTVARGMLVKWELPPPFNGDGRPWARYRLHHHHSTNGGGSHRLTPVNSRRSYFLPHTRLKTKIRKTSQKQT